MGHQTDIDIQAEFISVSSPKFPLHSGVVVMTDDKGNELGRIRIKSWTITQHAPHMSRQGPY